MLHGRFTDEQLRLYDKNILILKYLDLQEEYNNQEEIIYRYNKSLERCLNIIDKMKGNNFTKGGLHYYTSKKVIDNK